MSSLSQVKEEITIDEILSKARAYIEDEEQINIIKKAYQFAKLKHDGQFRKSGEAYIYHPMNVALILISVYADYETISAGLLHDVLEDCDCTPEEMEKEFGPHITKLVQGVTKLSLIHFSTENEYLIEYYKKIIVGMSEDVRVIIIKLADRLHNMRTLWAIPEDRQKVKAHEALDILAPIAHHLGIHKIKSELEDLSLRYLKPDVFYDIAEKLNKTKLERDKTVYDMQTEVSDLLTEHHIPHEIKGRAKSIYSIYNKLDKGKKFSDIYDLLALRILVDTDAECYLVLGLIHSRFKLIAKRFKDFIAMPKSNGYQSLHTTVFGVNNELYEIQIRTYEMNEVAENGLAAHWSYKEHRNAFNLSNTDAKLEFFKAVIDTSKNSEYENFNPVHDDSLYDNIYVFTPKGDVIELPKGSTPVDFAYKVHTKIGDSMVGALVNNQIVPLNYILQDSDVIKINTSKSSPGPSEDWLSFVKLSATKSKIKNFFAKTRKDELISSGKELLDKELRKKKISVTEFYSDDNIKKILKELKISSPEELYIEIASNKYTPKAIINIIYPKEEKTEVNVNKNIIKNELDINVSGLSDIRVSIASCCLPLPGDEIVGYITRNNGITIHRKSCSNLLHLEERMVEVSFNKVTKNKYLTSIDITLRDNENRLLDILNKFQTKNLVVDEIKTFYHDNVISYNLSFYVPNVEYLEKLIGELKLTKYVKEVVRI